MELYTLIDMIKSKFLYLIIVINIILLSFQVYQKMKGGRTSTELYIN